MAKPKGSNVRSQSEFASGMRGATSSRYAEERRKAIARAKAARAAEGTQSYRGMKGVLRDSEGKPVKSSSGENVRTGYKNGGKVATKKKAVAKKKAAPKKYMCGGKVKKK